jgi:hypothetical protein
MNCPSCGHENQKLPGLAASAPLRSGRRSLPGLRVDALMDARSAFGSCLPAGRPQGCAEGTRPLDSCLQAGRPQGERLGVRT